MRSVTETHTVLDLSATVDLATGDVSVETGDLLDYAPSPPPVAGTEPMVRVEMRVRVVGLPFHLADDTGAPGDDPDSRAARALFHRFQTDKTVEEGELRDLAADLAATRLGRHGWMIGRVEASAGSIEWLVEVIGVGAAVSGALYTGVAAYPSFREGLGLLFRDLVQPVAGLSRKLLRRISNLEATEDTPPEAKADDKDGLSAADIAADAPAADALRPLTDEEFAEGLQALAAKAQALADKTRPQAEATAPDSASTTP